MRAAYGSDVFTVMIPYAADFKEAIAARQTLAQYKPKGAFGENGSALADELLERLTDGAAEGTGEAA